MMGYLLVGVIILLFLNMALVIALFRRSLKIDVPVLQGHLEVFEKGLERTERTIRDEAGRNREEATHQARQLREEVVTSIIGINDSVVKSMGTMSDVQKGQMDSFSSHLNRLTDSNDKNLAEIRAVVEEKLRQLQQDNAQKLDQMRQTVDEKLQGALEKRLGESFRLVSEQLEQVHKGLGEMQALAYGIGDLKRVLTNVKVRGMWGEIQLGNLLEQVLAPDQFAANVKTKECGSERVEFAIKLPGHGDKDEDVVWLPLDAKFPHEDYQRLLDAQERADLEGIELATKQLESRIKQCAKDICEKYINPPTTTDFAIMFLPIEGLYAEVVRRTGLIEVIQRDCRVVVAGPTTLAALLNSLQMGFRTLAIQKQSSEVWTILAGVKTEFGKFGDMIQKVHKKLQEATNVVDDAARRSRAIERKLRNVQVLPASDSASLLLDSDSLSLQPILAATDLDD